MCKSRLRSVVDALNVLACVAALMAVTLPARAAAPFRYENCADQGSGMGLESCALVTIEEHLASVSIRDMSETTNGDARNGDFLYLESRDLPIAVPKTGYETQDWWTHGDHVYVKLVKQRSYFISKTPLDVIAVLPKSVDVSRVEDRGYIYDQSRLSFWYAPSVGVAAVAFAAKGQNADVFYCADERCLFATGRAPVARSGEK